MTADNDYHHGPAVTAYIERIGAEQRNFRRFIVKEMMPEDDGHYHREHVVKIEDGKVSVKEESLAPTEAEAAAIAAELHQRDFPKAILASRMETAAA